MKILHISTNDYGGASTATIRIHNSLIKIGIDSNILFLNKTSYTGTKAYQYICKNNSKIILPEKPALTLKNYIFEKIFHKHEKEEQRIKNIIESKKAFNKRIEHDTSNKFEVFSLPYSDYDITLSDEYQKADIIHLHWAAGFLDFKTFFSKNTKPVVISMHDENYILGAFHYEGDAIRNKQEYGKFEEDFIKLKKECYDLTPNLKVITGSDWIKEKAIKSGCFGNELIWKINYPINPERYRYLKLVEAKNMLNFPLDKKIFLFASTNVGNYRKGFDLLEPLIEDEELQDVIFVIMGTQNQKFNRKNVLVLGRVMDEITMPIIYAASDYYIIPSREENFSYAMIESLCCGTPSLAFSIGDHKSFLEGNNLGYTTDDISTKGLKKIILKAKNDEIKFDRKELAKCAISFFNETYVAKQFLEVYQA